MSAADPLTIHAVGLPAPQGSKRGFVVNGRVAMVESSKKVKPWRQDVTAAAQAAATAAGWETPAGPLRVDIVFYLPRPRYHYRTGAHAGELKPNAPVFVDKKPDKDKLERATCDALTSSGVIRDDAQIAAGLVEKRYADAATGAHITIRPITTQPEETTP
jgi:crossover junction endodeoxyribonuclease RusA